MGQFYQGGLRSWVGAPGPYWLPPEGITHPYSDICLMQYPLCTGYEGSPVGNAWRRRRSLLKARADQEEDVCGISYRLPDYPSTANEATPGPGSAQNINGIKKWYDSQDISVAGQVCNWKLNQFATRPTNPDGSLRSFASE